MPHIQITIIYSVVTMHYYYLFWDYYYLLNMQVPYVNDVLRLFRKKGHIQEFSETKTLKWRGCCENEHAHIFKNIKEWVGLPIGHDMEVTNNV